MGEKIRQRGKSWNVQVVYRGQFDSATFKTKNAARAWAAERKKEMLREVKQKDLLVTGKTLREAFDRYIREVSPTKKGERWERLRLQKLSIEPFSTLIITAINKHDINEYIERSLERVLPSTVNRELNLLSSVFKHAIEWGWCYESPLSQIKKLKNPPHRTRRVSTKEIETLLFALEFDEFNLIYPLTGKQELAISFLIALETAMRQGEIWGLTWNRVFLDEDKRYVLLPETKNGSSREVPLSTRAVELFKLLDRSKIGNIFRIKQSSAGCLFRRAVMLAGIEDLTFHDTRHEALTRLARKLDVLDLARMVGHRDPRSLMIYYNPTASEIAQRLG